MKLFDTFVSVPLVLLDTDTKRRELYGKAGSFRLQNWSEDAQGFEARTLSGFCIGNNDILDYIFYQINQMFDYYNTNTMKSVDEDADKIVECINTSNRELAIELCNKYKINVILEPVVLSKKSYEYS
jgi:hypothetical protein